MEQSTLIRSKNYLNLDNETIDEQHHQLNLSAFSNQEEQSKVAKGQYVNVDTQTSLDYDYEQQGNDEQDNSQFLGQIEEENNANQLNDYQTEQEEEEAEFYQNNNYDHRNDTTEAEPRKVPAGDGASNNNMDDDSDGNISGYRQLHILRELLAIERRRNEQRRQNSSAMQQNLQQMQTDYLRLQRDLVEALELGHKIKAQKEAQLESVAETVKEKDKLIGKLKTNLESLDETKLREEFNALLAKQNRLAEMEKQQLRDQIGVVEQQLVRERVTNSQTLQQFQIKLDEQLKLHDHEVELVRKKLTGLESELNRVLSEPQNLIIKELKEEKSQLSSQVDELNLFLSENQTKYESLRKRMESLLGEQEQMERNSQEEIDRLHEQHAEQRKAFNEVRLELEDKQEVIQILQFNLQRSEKRVKNLLGALNGKEATFKEMIGQLEIKHEQELEKSTGALRAVERKLIESESQLDKKQNELVKLELEHENQLESLRNDRDQRINKLALEQQKAERDLQAGEIKLARQFEMEEHKTKLIEQLQKEVSQFREESKRLSIELTKCEAKLFSKQQELNQAFVEKTQIEELQQSQLEQANQIFELEEVRRHSKRLEASFKELKADNEKLAIKLKLSESNMTKIGAAINKEHAKMVHDYERKLEQIRVEQSSYDRSRLRYKRYGYKLKKYCDHLRRVHEHLCNPSVCGYVIKSAKSQVNQSTPLKRTDQEDKDSLLNQESNSFSSDEDEEQHCQIYLNPIDRRKESLCCSTPTNAHRTQHRRHDKFTIKRTGISATTTTPQQSSIGNVSGSKSSARKPLQRSILKANNNLPPNSNAVHSTRLHDYVYYYINEDSPFVNVSVTK